MRGMGQRSGCVAVVLVKHLGSGDVKLLCRWDSHALAWNVGARAWRRLVEAPSAPD
jgi:hypothetical protein